MCLAIAIYVTVALKVRVAAPLDILATSLMLVTAAAVTPTRIGTRISGAGCRGRRSSISRPCLTFS